MAIMSVLVTGSGLVALIGAFLEHLEDHEGAVVLSKKKADFLRVWEKIKEAHEADVPVEGTLVRKIKGGLVVDIGVPVFPSRFFRHTSIYIRTDRGIDRPEDLKHINHNSNS